MSVVLTFGSCLSRFTAQEYIRQHGGSLDGAIYHNRIDQFVRVYISGESEELPHEDAENLQFTAEGRRRGTVMLSNQRRAETLGLHGIRGRPGFMKAIDHPVDIILMDTFVDLSAKLHRNHKGQSVFLTKRDLRSAGNLSFDEDRLPLEDAAAYWRQMITWLRGKQPKAKIVMLHFPFLHHKSREMASRASKFSAIFQDDRIDIIPCLPIFQQYIRTASHFAPEQYAMYAGFIRYLVMGRNLKIDTADDCL